MTTDGIVPPPPEAGGLRQQRRRRRRQHRRHRDLSHLSRIASLFFFAIAGFFVVSYHVRADDEGAAAAAAAAAAPSPSGGDLLSSNASSNTAARARTFRQRLAGGPDALNALDLVLFAALMLLAFELLDFVTKRSGVWLKSDTIPVRGKHLDDFTPKDVLFIGISKAATAPFVYFYLRFCYFEPAVAWHLSDLSLYNSLLPLPVLFVVYDFFYTLLHWGLHVKAIYPLIHKHHHVQKAPSRANVDAVNVHPIEFFLGEYNHLLALLLCTRYFQLPVHVVGAILFLAVGGILAGINHTRYDVVLRLLGGVKIFDSKAHDVHHRFPQTNYGQYIMLWDVFLGSYRAYDPNDSVNPDAQLDPKTGKSYAHGKVAAVVAGKQQHREETSAKQHAE